MGPIISSIAYRSTLIVLCSMLPTPPPTKIRKLFFQPIAIVQHLRSTIDLPCNARLKVAATQMGLPAVALPTIDLTLSNSSAFLIA